jgi:hypothetical protein
MSTIELRGRRRTGASRAAALLALALGAAGCSKDKLLEVNDPNVLLPGQVNSKDGLPVAYAGALSDITLAFGGSGGGPLTEGLINISGLFTDEFTISETFPDRIDIDRHTINTSNEPENDGLTLNFRQLHKARVSAEQAAADYAQYDDTNAKHAEVLGWAGYTYIMFAENFCSGVPFSVLDADGIQKHFGQPATTVAMYDTAIARFNAALAISGATANEKNLANLGLARAELGLGQFAAAAAAAASVPTTFVYRLRHSSNSGRENSGVWSFGRSIGRWTVGEKEGGVGLPFRSQADVRTPFARDTIGGKAAVGFDKATPLFFSTKYATRDSSDILASGAEARLIEAEASLQAGDAATWLTKLNGLRASAGLAALADPGTPGGRTDLHFQERAWWLQLTAHRLGDIRREVKFFSKPTSALYPSGAYFKGANYGPNLELPIPLDEVNNPNFTQCLDTGV